MISRRTFLATTIAAAAAAPALPGQVWSAVAGREALYYEKLAGGKVRCALCPRRCTIAAGDTGFCRARRNDGGTLFSLGYSLPCSLANDPVEKKPFYNFYPKSRSFSLACAGCNLRCKFCQNWEISQISPGEARNRFTPAPHLPMLAIGQGCKSVAFTYTEPTTFFEYMLDGAKAARELNVLTVMHSNGFINPEPLRELCRYLDAANIDLKGFSDEYYGSMCEAWLDPVLQTLKTLKQKGVWLELTHLVIPGYNDDPQMTEKMCRWIAAELGPETPIHFSRFFPLYKLTSVPPTPVPTLERALAIARKAGLHYPYIGNVPSHAGNSTYCPKCRKSVIRRAGFSVLEMQLKDGKCGHCGGKIAGAGLTLPS